MQVIVDKHKNNQWNVKHIFPVVQILNKYLPNKNQKVKITVNHFDKEYIRFLRNQLGLSQEGFARKLGVSFTTVNRWESDKSHPSQLAQKILLQLEEQMNNDDIKQTWLRHKQLLPRAQKRNQKPIPSRSCRDTLVYWRMVSNCSALTVRVTVTKGSPRWTSRYCHNYKDVYDNHNGKQSNWLQNQKTHDRLFFFIILDSSSNSGIIHNY